MIPLGRGLDEGVSPHDVPEYLTRDQILQVARQRLYDGFDKLAAENDRLALYDGDKSTLSSASGSFRNEGLLSTSGGGINDSGDSSSIMSYGSTASTDEEIDTSVQVELTDLSITVLPSEVIDLFHDNVSKLSLKGNLLSALPSNFEIMTKLSYLDLSGNSFTKFPQVLCSCPSLAILDISMNKLKELPDDIGNLMQSLQVLSLSNNPIKYLPPYIADIENLNILEVHNTPLAFPPLELISSGESTEEHFESTERMKSYLREHKHEFRQARSQLSDLSNLDSNGQNKFSISPPSSNDSAFASSSFSSSPASSSSPIFDNQPTRPEIIPSIPGYNEKYDGNFSTSPERLRSNSESQVMSRAAKRMGFLLRKPRQNSETDLIPTHVRGMSHDSAVESTLSPSASASTPYASSASTPSASMRNSSLRPPKSGRKASIAASPTPETTSGDYFKRLSTLPEEMKRSSNTIDLDQRIVEAARKILFASAEFHDIVRRCVGFCTDAVISGKLTSLLKASRNTFSDLVLALEKSGDEGTPEKGLIVACMHCMVSVKSVVQLFQANLDKLATVIDIKFLRTLIMITYSSFNELHNAWNLLFPESNAVRTTDPVETKISPQLGMTEGISDDELYDKLYLSVNTAQSVLNQLTEAISKSAAASAVRATGTSATVVAKVKDLTGVCVPAVDVTQRLKKRIESSRETGEMDRWKFWEDTNGFLKSVITILASTKSAMNDLPFLLEVRPNLTALTRTTKDIPVLLEYSSYNSFMGQGHQQQNDISQDHHIQVRPSVHTPLPTTPLVAVLGPAAQAVVSPQSSFSQ